MLTLAQIPVLHSSPCLEHCLDPHTYPAFPDLPTESPVGGSLEHRSLGSTLEATVLQGHGPVSYSHGKVLCGTPWSLPLYRAALTGTPGLDGHPHSMPSLAHSVFCFPTSISEQGVLPSCLASSAPPACENPKEHLSDIVF